MINRSYLLLIILICIGFSNSVYAIDISPDAYEQQKLAVELANKEQYENALNILESLISKYPEEDKFFYDYLIILIWSGQGSLAIDKSSRISIISAPEYVLKPLAKTARDNKEFNFAENTYNELLKRDPNNIDYIIGYELTQTDIGNAETALNTLLSYNQIHGEELQYLEALAYIYGALKNYVQQAHHYQKYLDKKPDDLRIRREFIISLKRLGAAKLALEQARQFPEAINHLEVNDIELDLASHYIRWGILPERDYRKRFIDTDNAIKIYEGVNDDNESIQQRKTYDLIVALHDRYRMQEAVDLFNTISLDIQSIPNYVLTVVANAFLYLEQPKKALELNRHILETEPENYKVNLSLFYTYIELDDFKNAYHVIDELAELQATWLVSPDNRIKKPNEYKLEADRVAVLARAYGDDLAYAQNKFETQLTKAPFNNDIRHDLGLVYRWRGWNQKALDAFNQVLLYEPEHISSQLGKAATNFNRRDYRKAEVEIQDNYHKYPENKEAQRQRKLWQSHNKRQLISDITLGTSNGNELGSRELIIDTYLYSKPIHYNYRAFLHYNHSTADFIEGNALEKRPGIGIEYRDTKNIVTAEINKALNHSEDIGITSKVTHYVDDYLNLTMAVELNSLQAPIRGRRTGIDADRYAVGVNYRWHESQQVGAELAFMDFDDGNSRISIQGFAERRVINQPKYKMTLRLNTAASINDQDNVIYYSPKRDFSLSITSDNLWRLYRRYEREFHHRLRISAGLYEQDGFGSSETWAIQYEHIWKVNRDLELLYGIGRSRRVFDGEAEFGNAIYGRIDWRF